MGSEAIIGLVLQTFIILAGIVALHMKTRDRITTLEVTQEAMDKRLLLQRGDHDKLGEKVSGISRHVERLDAKTE